LLVTVNVLPLPSAFKKKASSSQNKLIFIPKDSDVRIKIIEEKFGRNKMDLTFALPFKKWVAGKAKRSLKVGKQ
jgi:hypothetical protein